VPITKPVAGIAMGLMTHQGYEPKSAKQDFKVLMDLQGFEDHYGDMDFKVAGTSDGITAIQMDIKIEGITPEIYKSALALAQKGRMQILKLITDTIPEPRPQLSEFAPIIRIFKIKPAQIGTVIGPGGKMINGIIEQYGLETIVIDEDGSVYVAGRDVAKVEQAVALIQSITKEYEVGEVVTGPVVRIMEFGAIVDLGGGRDGMIHVSEVQNGFLKNVGDVLKVGQTVSAKIIRVDESGKIGLSIKALQQK
jgi:polyribonucleotide nucleotidyltransferase